MSFKIIKNSEELPIWVGLNTMDIMKKEPVYDYTQNLTRLCIQSAVKKREDQILNRLAEYGYQFSNRHELEQFVKTRCILEKYPNRLTILRADGKYICEWWDTSRFENDGKTFTCIMGEPLQAV